MSDDENIINSTIRKSKNKLWNIFTNIIKCILILLIIGFIMLCVSEWGAEVYTKDSSNRSYTGGWNYHEYLNPVYGLIGIIIYILINYFGFLSYKRITDKFKKCKATISKSIFILFNIFINILMLILYSGLFSSYSFKNIVFEILNTIIIDRGWITFPIIFFCIYEKN